MSHLSAPPPARRGPPPPRGPPPQPPPGPPPAPAPPKTNPRRLRSGQRHEQAAKRRREMQRQRAQALGLAPGARRRGRGSDAAAGQPGLLGDSGAHGSHAAHGGAQGPHHDGDADHLGDTGPGDEARLRAASTPREPAVPVKRGANVDADEVERVRRECEKRARRRTQERRKREREEAERKALAAERARDIQNYVGASAGEAERRLRLRRARELRHRDDVIEQLIKEQESSIDAMHIARLISPRFEAEEEFEARVKKGSKTEQRLKALLENDRIGNFYH